MKKAIQRIIKKDIKSVESLTTIQVEFDETDIMKAKAIIMGPENSCYENCFLLFTIQFPKNYPFSPPHVEFVPFNKIRIHPNIYASGKVCLSLLGTWSGPKWTSIMDLSSILLSIQSLLDKDPIRNEPGYACSKTKLNTNYNTVIEYNSIQSLLIDTYNHLPSDFYCFREFIKTNIL